MYRITVNFPDRYKQLIEAECDAKGYKSASAFLIRTLEIYFQSSEAATHPDGLSDRYIGRSSVNERYERLKVQVENTKRLEAAVLAIASRLAKTSGVGVEDIVSDVDAAMPLAGKRTVLPTDIKDFLAGEEVKADAKAKVPTVTQLAPEQSKPVTTSEPDQEALAEFPSFDFLHTAKSEEKEPASAAPVQSQPVMQTSKDDRMTLTTFDPFKLPQTYKNMYVRYIHTAHTTQDADTFKRELLFLATLHELPGMDAYMSSENLFANDGSVKQDVADLIADELAISDDAEGRAAGKPVMQDDDVSTRLTRWCDDSGRAVDPRRQ